jgi:hypothetical protein
MIVLPSCKLMLQCMPIRSSSVNQAIDCVAYVQAARCNYECLLCATYQSNVYGYVSRATYPIHKKERISTMFSICKVSMIVPLAYTIINPRVYFRVL